MAAVVGGLSLAAASMSSGLAAGEITTALKVHKEAYQQDKRFFYAAYTEAVAHHGEAYAQAQRLHSQSYALSDASYHQADKHHRRSFQQAKLQHKIDRDISMRAEIREGLRDEFGQKNNRYNALMVCQTVMLTCAFQLSLVDVPSTMWATWLWVYSGLLGTAFGLLSLSLWFNFIVTRRLNQYTAGVMQVEMHLSEEWRRKRGVDDVLDAALLRDYFRKWFGRHCSLLATASMHLFSCGVVSLFGAASISLHARFELRNQVPGASLPFWTVLGLTTISIFTIEARERRLTKQKLGVYSRPWVGKLTSSLRDQIGDLLRFEEQRGPNDASEEQEMMQSANEQMRSRRLCPESTAVAKTAGLTENAAKTEQLLEKAWRMFQENEQKEREFKQEDWERDDWMSDILTEVQQLQVASVHILVQLIRYITVQLTVQRSHPPRLDVCGQKGRSAAVAASDTVNVSADGEVDDNASQYSGSEFQSENGESIAESMFSGVSTVAGAGAPGRIKAVDEIELIDLRRKLGSYFRSTLVHVRNETGAKLHLKTRRIGSGTWYPNKSPPTTIHPYTEVVFCSTSKSRWVGGTEAEVIYDTRGQGTGPPWTCKLKWANAIVAGEKGRYCEVESGRDDIGPNAQPRLHGPTSVISAHETHFGGEPDRYFVTKDDDDQEENSEVFFTVTSTAEQETARGSLGQDYSGPRQGSSVTGKETVKSGSLQKRRPDGLGFFWQLRWFVLTRTKLCYFKNSVDTRAHAQLGQIPLKHVIAVHSEDSSTEFVVVVANSQRPPYTLKSESVAAAQEWIEMIEMHAPRLAQMRGGSGMQSMEDIDEEDVDPGIS